MEFIYRIHATYGEMILPLLIVLAAIYFAIAWRPGSEKTPATRLFPVLVDLQFTLGLIWWVYGIVAGFGTAAGYLGWPFILHPILGLLSVAIAHVSVSPRGPFARLGRWGALAGLALLLVSVLAGVVIARSTGQA